ncbi:MAG: 4-hydroxy-tetrahydrodipicolinate synthase [Gammaproteobacteria bacterium]|jgi:4-hydroxy-tetrahydrodipicolinate synthase
MISGSIVAIVTPMHVDGSVDGESLYKLLDWHVESGTDAIVTVGTTGESATLTHDEHCEVIGKTIDYVNGRIPVIAGTGANSTSEAIELTRFAARAGADAALLVTPYYNKPTQEGLFQHYRLVAESVDIPQILYNVPGRTAVDMAVETVVRLCEVPNIVGLKEAAADGPERVAALRQGCGDAFALYSGNDDTARQFVLNGGNGVISVTANVAPAEMHDMIAAALAGDPETAASIDAKLSLLHERLFIESSPIPAKWALAEMHRIEAGIRLPLTWLDDEYHTAVREALAHAGIQ